MTYSRGKGLISAVWQALISPEYDAYWRSPLLWALKPRANKLTSQFSYAIMQSAIALSTKGEG